MKASGMVSFPILAAFVLGLCAMPARAQTPNSTDAACERGWLASDWPTVVVECSNEAEASEQDRAQQQAMRDNAPQGFDTTPTYEFAAADALFAGMAWARAAIGYAKLKKHALYVSTRQKALADLATAISEATTPQLRQKAVGVQSLVSSALFVIDAPDSDVLSHI